MAVKRRRCKAEKYDVVISFGKKRHRITTVDDKQYATAISNVANETIGTAKVLEFADARYLGVLKTLNVEAYQSIRGLSNRFDVEAAREHESENYRETQRWQASRAESKAMEFMRGQIAKLASISNAPAPIRRDLPYPEPPKPVCSISKSGIGLPSSPGVYFLFGVTYCEYVGQSINIANRANYSHERAVMSDRVGWLLFDASEILFAESYYIGILRPQRNFRGFRRDS